MVWGRPGSEGDVRFIRRAPVAWLEHDAMAHLQAWNSARGEGLIDTRETQAATLSSVDTGFVGQSEMWIDYVAGLGDGFDATYSVASVIAGRQLDIEEDMICLPRASMLIAGGNQVHAKASWWSYRDRFVGPFASALPWTETPHPRLYALPGYNDWTDGLVGFRRTFTQGAWVGGWRTQQHRSYFAVQLPHRWWILGIDIPDGSPIDEDQLQYFSEALSRHSRPGDRIVLCVPRASWIRGISDPTSYDSLAYLEAGLFRPQGLALKLCLAGDFHSYSRYSDADADLQSEEDADSSATPDALTSGVSASVPPAESSVSRVRHWINCGAGGSYTSGTAILPSQVVVPPVGSRFGHSYIEERTLAVSRTYPSRRTSRHNSFRAIYRLVFANPSFAALLGILYTLLMLGIVGLPDAIDNAGFALASGVILTILIPRQYGSIPEMLQRVASMGVPILGVRLRDRLMIGATILVHIGFGYFGASAWAAVLPTKPEDWTSLVLAITCYAPLAALCGGALSGLLAIVQSQLRRRTDPSQEALFAGIAIQDMKCFLRLHLNEDGEMTVYAVGIDKVFSEWQLSTDTADPETPFWQPRRGEIRTRIVDRVVVC